MKHHVRNFITAAGIAAAFGTSFDVFADHAAVSPNLGTPIHVEAFDRAIQVAPKTKWVNVTRNETIKFVVSGDTQKSFVWRFDTLGTPVIDLRTIAPPGILSDRHIDVYVAPDPSDR